MSTVTLTQFMRPSGRPEEVTVGVPDEYVARVGGMVLTTEVLTTGQVAIYAKWEGQPDEAELCEIATNGPGPESPTTMLLKLIDRLAATGREAQRE